MSKISGLYHYTHEDTIHVASVKRSNYGGVDGWMSVGYWAATALQDNYLDDSLWVDKDEVNIAPKLLGYWND